MIIYCFSFGSFMLELNIRNHFRLGPVKYYNVIGSMIASSGAKPKRTMLFCAFAGEEFGLLGHKHGWHGRLRLCLGWCTDHRYNFSYDEIWHTERDLYTKSIPEYQKHAATVMAIVGLGVANLDHQLSREGLYLKEE